MERFTVDRIAEGMAVLLWRKDEIVKYDIPVNQLPKDISEGDILDLEIKEGKVVRAKIDRIGTEKQKRKIEDKIKKLLEKGR